MNRQHITTNPFTPGGVITSHDKFFGREKILSAIQARLRGMLSVSVVGEARMGKSSLLKVLQADVTLWDGYLPLYLSMDSYRTQESFCRALLKQLLPHMRPPSDNQQENEEILRDIEKRIAQREAFTFEETAEVLELAHAWGLRVVLLLDEFKDLLEKAEEFDDAFRGQLRSLYNTNRTVALVLATRQPITQIPQLNAYFANGITMHELQPLHADAARALLTQPHDHPFSDEEVNLGLQVAKNHPLRLQLVGFQLYFWKTQATNPLYGDSTHLHPNAYNILHAPVEKDFEHMMLSSKEPSERMHNIGDSLNKGRQWLNGYIVQPIRRLIEFIANMQGNISAILFLLFILGTILATCGWIKPEAIQWLLDWIEDNS